MLALTVCNPYPYLIFDLEKRVENRTWQTKHRGWLLLHAGQSKEWLRPGDAYRWPNMRFGVILGQMEIVDCVHIGDPEAHERYPWLADHEHAYGPYCWIIGSVQRLHMPIRCKGSRMLWHFPWTPPQSSYLEVQRCA